jgi:hypothetical protein
VAATCARLKETIIKALNRRFGIFQLSGTTAAILVEFKTLNEKE